MDIISIKQQACQVIKNLGLANIKPDWSGCDAMWIALEEMANEGATVVVKIDGQRTSSSDNGRYTVLVSGGPLGSEDFFRVDTPILEEGLAKAVIYYAEKFWKQL